MKPLVMHTQKGIQKRKVHTKIQIPRESLEVGGGVRYSWENPREILACTTA